jgi:hypothetical protein
LRCFAAALTVEASEKRGAEASHIVSQFGGGDSVRLGCVWTGIIPPMPHGCEPALRTAPGDVSQALDLRCDFEKPEGHDLRRE